MIRPLGLAALLATLALSACGGGSTGGSAGATADPSILSQPASVTVTAGLAPLASTAYHLHLAANDGTGDIVLDIDQDGQGNVKGTLSIYGHVGEIAIVGDRLFLKGADLISQETGTNNSGTSWVRYPSHPLAYFDTLRKGGLLRQCITDLGGTFTVAGRGSVNGRDTVEVDGAGDAQGGTAIKLYINVGDPVLLVRWTVTRSGQAPPDSCNGGQAATTAAAALPTGTIDFSNVGVPVTIHPPAGAVDAQ